MAHVVLSNPFTTVGHVKWHQDSIVHDANQGNGPAPSSEMVRLHVWAVAQLRIPMSPFFRAVSPWERGAWKLNAAGLPMEISMRAVRAETGRGVASHGN